MAQKKCSVGSKVKPQTDEEKGLVPNFENMAIRDVEAESQGNQTPEKEGTYKDSKSRVSRKLFDDEERQTGPPQDEGKQAKGEKSAGNESMRDAIDMSKVYTVSSKWTVKGEKKKVHLRKIYSHLAEFLKEMKGKTCRQELEDVLQIDESSDTEGSENEVSEKNSSANKGMESGGSETKASPKMLRFKPISDEYLTPHVKEIVYMRRKKDEPKDKPDLPEKKESFTAYSLPLPQNPLQTPNIWFLDCEYMCKVHLPGNTSNWLDVSDTTGNRITEAKPDKIEQRWIFTPSFRRAKIALLDWPDDQILKPENTIRILVVRPTEFEEYVKYCGHKFHIISLPNDEIGAGYSRLWIQKIALRLKLNFIWMIDDSLKYFHDHQPDDGKGTVYLDRRLEFGTVFQKIEQVVQNARSQDNPIAVMSPRRSRGTVPSLEEPVTHLPSRVAVYLNLKALKSREIYYRPELQTYEDMIFAYECEQNGLQALIDNHIRLQDKYFRDTGARSSSVQQKMKEPDEEF